MQNNEKPDLTRRRMLMRLGLAAGAIYAAPVMLQLSEAKASSGKGSRSSVSVSGRRRPRRVEAEGRERIARQPQRRRRVTSISR